MTISPGTVLNNRYRIVKLLGQAGFGVVYRAWDMNMEGLFKKYLLKSSYHHP